MSRIHLRRGFTLIELLVVIAIIGLISSIVLSSLSVARSKARDSQRKAQASQFMRALEIYYSANGTYPYAATPGAIGVQHFTTAVNVGQALVAANAISQIPLDPLYPSTQPNTNCNVAGYGYCYCSSGGNSYVLTVNTEDDQGGSDRCYIEHGPSAATFCQGHHGDPGDIAGTPCSDRF